MKKLSLRNVLGLGLMGVLSLAQSALAAGWVNQTSPTASDLYGVSCASSTGCVAVGDAGAMVRTSNMTSWATVASGTTEDFLGVSLDAANSGFGVAVTKDGSADVTHDNGATWTLHTRVAGSALKAVSVVSSTVAYVANYDYQIYKTSDGGATWAKTAGALTFRPYALQAVDANNLFAAGQGGMTAKSSDGGASWTTVATGTGNLLFTIAMSGSTGYVGGANKVFFKTTNGGASWTAVTLSAFGATEDVTAVSFGSTSNSVYVVGDAGDGEETADGSSWTSSGNTPASGGAASGPGLNGLALPSSTTRVAVGANGSIFLYDSTAPSTPTNFALTSGNAYSNSTTPTFSWTASTDGGSSAAPTYQLIIDGAYHYTVYTTSETSPTSLAAGNHTATLTATDATGNVSSPATLSFTIDTTAPAVTNVLPLTATAGTAVNFYTAASDSSSGIKSCVLYVNGTGVGNMTLSGAYYYGAYTFATSGTATVYAACNDNAGNAKTGTSVTVTVSAAATTTTDSTAPTIGTLSPTSATAGTSTNLYTTVSDGGSGVASCTLYVNGVSVGAMTLSGGYYYAPYTFSAAGSYPAYAHCTDNSGNSGNGTAVTVTVAAATSTADVTGPTVSSLTPTTATVGADTKLSVTASDSASGVAICKLYMNGSYATQLISQGNGTYTSDYTFQSAGSNTAYAYCTDNSGNSTTGASTTITASGASTSTDATAPSISFVTPSAMTQGSSATLTVNYSDAVGVTSCYFGDDLSTGGTMTLHGTTSGYATYTYSTSSTGTRTLYARCYDAAGNPSNLASTSVSVGTSYSYDSVAPSVSTTYPTTASLNSSTTYYVTYADAYGVARCELYADGYDVGTMTLSGSTSGTAYRAYTFTTSGTHTIYGLCWDAAGNAGYGTAASVSVSGSSTSTTTLTVGSVTPTVATVNVATTYSVPVSDNYSITGCHLIINGADYGTMSLVSGGASVGHTLTSTGAHTVYVTCTDSAGRSASGPATSVYVYATGTGTAVPGQLMKTQCATNASANDPCKAVYYYGSDSKRHAFPNEKVFYTWYGNFNSVVTVDSNFLASLTLGRNVTYHAGVKMVKFTSVNTVYVVQAGGYLLPLYSETVAYDLYGSNWNHNIDDISDAFYSNYRFGGTVTSASGYSISGSIASEGTIDQDLTVRD